MRWSILTPYCSAHWDGERLLLGDGASRADAPGDDALEPLWRTYYASIFNPARLKVRTMTREMPVRYWKNLPEAQMIPDLVREAHPRTHEMVEQPPTSPRKRIAAPAARAEPLEGSLEALQHRARDCRACDLWKPATQTVFGEGPPDATVMLVGEQPGDQEDLAGRPFVGPAGRLLDHALAEVGLDRRTFYVTNVVKHFKFQARGKTRLHQRASAEEQRACRPWLDAQIAHVRPRFIVCLGAMAASQVLGASFRLMRQRGTWHALDDGTRVIATVHPAYLLRLPGGEEQERAYAAFVGDLQRVGEALREHSAELVR
jgi:DNA polymerase